MPTYCQSKGAREGRQRRFVRDERICPLTLTSTSVSRASSFWTPVSLILTTSWTCEPWSCGRGERWVGVRTEGVSEGIRTREGSR